MASDYETFWQMNRYAVVGHSQLRPFPQLTYAGLKKNGKIVYPVDETAATIDGDRTYASLSELPESVDAAVIEVPKTEALKWCRQAVDCGVQEIWLHMNTESPEVVAFAEEHRVRLRTGTCAVMYLHRGFSPHAIHGFVRKLLGKY